MAGATRRKCRALQNWLLVWWDKYIIGFCFSGVSPGVLGDGVEGGGRGKGMRQLNFAKDDRLVKMIGRCLPPEGSFPGESLRKGCLKVAWCSLKLSWVLWFSPHSQWNLPGPPINSGLWILPLGSKKKKTEKKPKLTITLESSLTLILKHSPKDVIQTVSFCPELFWF